MRGPAEAALFAGVPAPRVAWRSMRSAARAIAGDDAGGLLGPRPVCVAPFALAGRRLWLAAAVVAVTAGAACTKRRAVPPTQIGGSGGSTVGPGSGGNVVIAGSGGGDGGVLSG